MADDEETMARQRLARLFEPAPSRAVPGPTPAGRVPPLRPDRASSEPVLASGSALVSRSALASGPVPSARGDRSFLGPAGPGGRVSPRPPAPGPAAGAGEAVPADEGAPGPGDDRRSLVSRLPGPGAFDPGRRGVRALAVVAVVVALVAGVWAWRARPRVEPVTPVAAASDGPLPAATGTPSAAGQVVVAVAGKVRRPGLVRLPTGARVADAVEAAGGALPGVDVALLNPARKLADGELIVVGVAAPAGQAAPPGAAAAGAPGGPVNLNTATLAQLDALPGVGPVLAQRILDHRERHGGFRSVSDLRQVEGIGDARYEQLKDLVTV